MSRPALLVIDDDPEVLRAIARDLRRAYRGRYRVLEAASGGEGLDTLRELKRRGGSAALLLADQRMPEMTGVEFLREAAGVYSDAKRALLTAYADTEAAIQAINAAHIHYYLQKPWDPPEEKLFPVVSELLEEWESRFRPAFEGVRIVGHRWSPEAHRIRDFLARNQVPYRWLDIEDNPESAALLAATGLEGAALPLVLFPDGEPLAGAGLAQVAQRIGLHTRAEQPFYALVIVGAGPAGLGAAVYAASEGVRTLLIEEQAPGGQAGQSSRIENYLGLPAGVSGGELARRAVAQARKFGVEILTPQSVVGLRVEGPVRSVVLSDGTEVGCHSLLVATGVSYRKLDVPGVDGLVGAGVYYGAALTEAQASAGGDVYLVGGGNSAGQAAMYLSTFAAHVTLLVRGPDLAATMSHYLIEQLRATPNIAVRPHTEVAAAEGAGHLERLVLRDNRTAQTECVPAAGLFILIGAQPRTGWLEGVVVRDAHGFLPTGADLSPEGKRLRGWPLERDPFLLETGVPGIFAAGDVRKGSMKRVASGVGEGAMAVSFVHQYLAEL